MEENKTVCYKINRSLEIVTQAVETGEADPVKLAEYLHDIRHDAQLMENGLKLRKEIMVREGLEDEYIAKKKAQGKPTKGGINEVHNKKEQRVVPGTMHYEFIVKENGKVVYQSPAVAGVVNVVEEIQDIDKYGAIEGVTQNFIFGHDLAIWFSFDQLRMAMEHKKLAIMAAIKGAVDADLFNSTVLKVKLMRSMNNKNE